VTVGTRFWERGLLDPFNIPCMRQSRDVRHGVGITCNSSVLQPLSVGCSLFPRVNVHKFKVTLKSVVSLLRKNTIFWYITSCSNVKVNRSFGGIYRLHLLRRSLNQARKQIKQAAGTAVRVSLETSFAFQRITCHRIPDDTILYGRRCENLKSNKEGDAQNRTTNAN
jgi:hypothetical protein